MNRATAVLKPGEPVTLAPAGNISFEIEAGQRFKLTQPEGEPYRYLVESIRKFPDQERFAGFIRDAGFSHVGYRNFTGGIAALHWGVKL